jgi:ribonuclease P protein component
VEVNSIMLKKENRLKDKQLIKEILKKGKKIKEGCLLLKYFFSKGKPRFTFIVSKKISKKAVVRNKIKRHLSEITRVLIKELPLSLDGVFLALPGIERLSFQEKKEIVFKILKKIKNGYI